MFGAILGASSFYIGPEICWIFAFFVGSFGLIISKYIEAEKLDSSKNTVDSKFTSQLKNPFVISLFVIGIAFGLETGIRSLIVPPYVLEITDNNVFFMGVFGVILAIIRLVGIIFYKNFLAKYNNGIWFAVIALVTFGTAEIIVSNINSFWMFISVYAVGVCALGWYFPIQSAIFNELIEDKHRATLLSTESMLINGASAVACLLVSGHPMDSNIGSYWLYAGYFVLIAAAIMAAIGTYRYQFNKNTDKTMVSTL
jgi:hypothetical protein